MKYLLILAFIATLSCNNERVLKLPNIQKAPITKVLDHSSVYIFYDETQKDSTLFNRNNLISTTNWVIHIDKRVKLKQALPHLMYLQEKREKKTVHTNKSAKNYFTCNDLNMNNLGFLDFTDISYTQGHSKEPFKKEKTKKRTQKSLHVKYNNTSIVEIIDEKPKELEKQAFESYLKSINKPLKIYLNFNCNLSFQDYISIKSYYNQLNLKNLILSKKEFIYSPIKNQ